MGTEKRERQRANKAQKQHQQARAETRQKGTRLAVIVGGAVLGVIAIAWVANTFISDDDSSDAPTETLAEATAAESSVYEPTGEIVPAGCPTPAVEDEQTQTFESAPPACLDDALDYSAIVTTNKGEITVDLDEEKAPNTVNNFVFLARNQYFDNTECHRIIPGFVVQCGDPSATGGGDPGYRFADELPEQGEYQIGSIAMANSGPDTNGSQFFIITGDQGAALPPAYSLFGAVSTGFDETVVEMEAAGTETGSTSEPIIIESVVIVTA